jgi:hypothetical protein
MWSDKCTYRRTPVGRKNNVRISSENKNKCKYYKKPNISHRVDSEWKLNDLRSLHVCHSTLYVLKIFHFIN